MQEDTTLRMYAIVRPELEMSTGKCSAQCGHAFIGTHIDCQLRDPERIQQYDNGTKVVLQAPLHKILSIYEHCQLTNISSYLVEDSGHICKHFDGLPIITALGVGPLTRAEAQFLSSLPCVGDAS